jgi:hypothetical protein
MPLNGITVITIRPCGGCWRARRRVVAVSSTLGGADSFDRYETAALGSFAPTSD